MACKKGFITKEQFRQNMGLLGMNTVQCLSDRIFSVIDSNNDNQIDFNDFVLYYDIVMNGSQEEKSFITFQLIDNEKKGYFRIKELGEMIKTVVSSWSTMTGQSINMQTKQKIDYYIAYSFQQMDKMNTGKVTLQQYKDAISKQPDLLEVFDYISRGIIKVPFSQSESRYMSPKAKISSNIENLKLYVEKLKIYLKGDELEIDSLDLDLNNNNNTKLNYTELNIQSHHSFKNVDGKDSPDYSPKRKIKRKRQKNLTMQPSLLVTKNLSGQISYESTMANTQLKQQSTNFKDERHLFKSSSTFDNKLISKTTNNTSILSQNFQSTNIITKQPNKQFDEQPFIDEYSQREKSSKPYIRTLIQDCQKDEYFSPINVSNKSKNTPQSNVWSNFQLNMLSSQKLCQIQSGDQDIPDDSSEDGQLFNNKPFNDINQLSGKQQQLTDQLPNTIITSSPNQDDMSQTAFSKCTKSAKTNNCQSKKEKPELIDEKIEEEGQRKNQDKEIKNDQELRNNQQIMQRKREKEEEKEVEEEKDCDEEEEEEEEDSDEWEGKNNKKEGKERRENEKENGEIEEEKQQIKSEVQSKPQLPTLLTTKSKQLDNQREGTNPFQHYEFISSFLDDNKIQQHNDKNQNSLQEIISQENLHHKIDYIIPKLDKIETYLDSIGKQLDTYQQQQSGNFSSAYQGASTFNHPGVKEMVNITKGNIHKNTGQKKNEKIKSTAMVLIGHENWNLVVNMMMGIQMAVRSASSVLDNNLIPDDFKLKYYFELLPKRQVGERSTLKVCKFSDYAPNVFNKIRSLYQINNDDYLKSIGPDLFFSSLLKGDLSTLKEFMSTGKSGSFFYYTVDSKYLLKTISSTEFNFLKKILQPYYNHLEKNPNTYITRFFGMHKIKFKMCKARREKQIYFVIMSNVFSIRKEIHERYDIKGSLYKRTSNDPDPLVAKKDLDILKSKFKFDINQTDYHQIMKIIAKDCQFFAEQNIIDYSLLLGINYRSRSNNHINLQSSNIGHPINEASLDKKEQFQSDFDLLQLNQFFCVQSRTQDKLYFFGIIDILTHFNTKKKLEYIIKRAALGPTISAVPAAQYAQRFLKFIDDMFDKSSFQK